VGVSIGGYEMIKEQIGYITSNIYGNLTVNVIALAIAMLIVWYMYRKIAKRDMFSIPDKYYGGGLVGSVKKLFSIIMYFIKYGLLFPIYSFLMFALLSISIFFLSTGMPVVTILYVSIVIISVVRLLAYINEDASQELAKMLPFALILLILTNPNITQQYRFPDVVELKDAFTSIWQYFIFLIGLEFILRFIYLFVHRLAFNHGHVQS